MRLHSSALTLAIGVRLISAMALPNAAPSSCTTKVYDANFDDLTGLPGNGLNPIPTPYDGLFYQGFDFATVIQTNLAPGLIPHSGTNYAAASFVTQLAGTSILTVNYPASAVTSFSLSSFYYGCVLNLVNAAADLPLQCNIQVTGYNGSDNTIASSTQVFSQQFTYNPTTAVGPQQLAFSKKLKAYDISFAVITFSLPGGQSALNSDLAVVFDDFVYTTKTCKPH